MIHHLHTLDWTLLDPYTPNQMQIKRKKTPNVMSVMEHLYPIEVNAKDDKEPNGEIIDTPSLECTSPNSKPHRNAAVVADILRKLQS